MPAFNLTRNDKFPNGTSVGLYAASQFPDTGPNLNAAPPGSATANATVTNGVAAFSGVAAGIYYAYAKIGNEHRYVRVHVGQDTNDHGFAELSGTNTWTGAQTFEDSVDFEDQVTFAAKLTASDDVEIQGELAAAGPATFDDDVAVDGDLVAGTIGVANAVAGDTPGSCVASIEVFDEEGNSLGFVPVYDAITDNS